MEIRKFKLKYTTKKITNYLGEEFYTLEKSCFVMNGF